MEAPDLEILLGEDGCELRLRGGWCIRHLVKVDQLLADLQVPHDQPVRVDASGLTRLDSAGVTLAVNRLRAMGVVWSNVSLRNFKPAQLTLIHLIAERLDARSTPAHKHQPILRTLGKWGERLMVRFIEQFAFLGQIVEALWDLVRRPAFLRHRELTVQLQTVGLGALPIIALMTFLVGVVFAFLLGIQVQKFGANIFVVDGIALAVARELSPMLTAILVAGRSGAAFTAQIGAMKVTEEIDAISTLGLSPIQVLVLPRLIALVIALPLLTFVGDAMGILGASVVAASQLDVTYFTFFDRLKSVLPVNTVLFGLSKAPVFAAAIAFIACRNGFAVSRDAASVGAYTTTTVVQSLVAVILINAAFAIAHPELPQ
jgi:phospholipid/cholesterol/gamma-HCH transport system permease protein